MGSVDPRWYESFFGEDWLKIYRRVPEEHTVKQVDFLLEQMKLPDGAHVLDVACGGGRHSIELARRGYHVTGIDLSEPSLAFARKREREAGVQVTWIHGDMREIPLEAAADAAINLWTAFGYFESEEEDLRALRAIARALKPGGAFMLETLNTSGLMSRFQPRSWDQLPDGTLLIEERKFDARTGRIDNAWTFISPEGERREQNFTHQLYTPPELERLMARAGLAVEGMWGDASGSPLKHDSIRLWILARR